MTDTLSFPARTVYDAFNRVGLYNEPSFESDRKALAAALRAAASQLTSTKAIDTLRDIAAELESQ